MPQEFFLEGGKPDPRRAQKIECVRRAVDQIDIRAFVI